VLENDRDNDQLRYSITLLFSVTHFQCVHVSMQYGNAETTILLLFVTVTTVLSAEVQKKREYQAY